LIRMPKDKRIVLYHENDPIFARVVRVKFKHDAGWSTVISEGYDDALDDLNDLKPDMLLTEIIIRDEDGRDGYKFIKEAKKITKKNKIPLVVLTALRQKEDLDKAWDAGADYIFVKSELSVNALIEELKDILK
jgi:CheY-like chemotaxis protein